MHPNQVLETAVAHPATDMATAIVNGKTTFTVKPGPFKEMANAEIVRRVARVDPDEVVLADFPHADLKELLEAFQDLGVAVTVAPYSVTQL